jgi:2Fe-2S ferredoxin
MHTREKSIVITILREGCEYVLNTYPNEYRNLMELLNDKLYIEDFGDCRGMGRCGTCTVTLLTGIALPDGPERKEGTTLSRFGYNQTQIRLSCQIMIDASIHGLRMEVI